MCELSHSPFFQKRPLSTFFLDDLPHGGATWQVWTLDRCKKNLRRPLLQVRLHKESRAEGATGISASLSEEAGELSVPEPFF